MTEKARPDAQTLAELVAQHHAIELRLAELDRHLALTAEEQLERARLKKLKLQTKDRMARRG
jgi:hypothetical protein